jgi:hypothetical protein
VTAQPFPPPLKWTLLGSIGVLVLMSLSAPNSSATRTVTGVIGVAAILVQLIAVPIAIRFLLRPEYRSPANIAMTVVAALPPVVVIVGFTALMLGFGHFHI